MFWLIISLLVGVGIGFLLNLIPISNWFLFLWIPLGMILGLIICFLIIYFILIPWLYKMDHKKKLHKFFVQTFAKYVCVFLNVKIDMEGKENITEDDSVLYVSNHKSLLDPVFVCFGVKRALSFAAKQEVRDDYKPLRPLLKTSQVIFIDRENDRNSVKEILKGIKLIKDGKGLLIFPEGGIKTRDLNKMVSLKPGAYKLATKSKATIQPVVLLGNHLLDTRKSWFKRVHIHVKVLPAIKYEEYKDLNTNEIGMKVVEMVNANFDEKEEVWFDE